MNNRQIVECEYQELIGFIKNTADELNGFGVVNQQSKKLKARLITSLEDKLRCVQNTMEQSLNDMHWDKLVISLFGETNAGKSTIIETFRILFDQNRAKQSDGRIVGDGRSDFTKDYHEYELMIEGCPFILIDVPGIEGDEQEFKDGIKKALNKSHCVFYVHGHNKPLEGPIAEKIKSYLGEWVQVYSIYNVRGGINQYDESEERESLLTDKIVQMENLIKDYFSKCLGDVYKGNITLQALLAMCAKASFSVERGDLSGKQEKLLNYFNSAESILQFSQFQTLINQIQQKANKFSDEITSANMLKVRAFKREILQELDNIIKEVKINEYKSQLELFASNLNSITQEINQNLKSRVQSLVYAEFDSVENEVFRILQESEDKQKDLDTSILLLTENIGTKMQNIIKESSESWNEYIKRKSEDFDGFDSLLLKLPNIQVKNGLKMDFSDALEKIGVEISDVGGFAAAVGSGALVGGGVGGPFGATVGGVAGGASYLGKKMAFGDCGLGEAKKLAKEELYAGREWLKPRLGNLVQQLQTKILAQKDLLNVKIQTELDAVDSILTAMSKLQLQFKQFKIL